jgi:hypothetical protein
MQGTPPILFGSVLIRGNLTPPNGVICCMNARRHRSGVDCSARISTRKSTPGLTPKEAFRPYLLTSSQQVRSDLVSSALEILIGAVVVVVVIVGQVKGQMLRGRRVILLPVVLLIIGLVGLAGVHGMTALGVGLIGLSTAIAAAIGMAQGAWMHLEERPGGLWGRMPGRAVWLWGALVLSRIAVIALGALLGAKAASSTDAILFVLGVNRLAQGGIITLRAMAAGIPFAAEKDGRVFGPARRMPSPLRDTCPSSCPRRG